MTTLAVIVITKNEARNIVACLQSVRFADQIVVLDSESTDGTAELAKSMGAELSQSADWPGFGIQKNRALALANCDWVLSIDADERITPDRITRLFKRGSASFSNDLVHEKLITHRAVGRLQAHLLHESFNDFEAVLDKANRYSTAGAQHLLQQGKKASIRQALGHGLWAFVRTYVFRLGFLDGRMGLLLAISNAEGTYYRYLKVWLMSQPNSKSR